MRVLFVGNSYLYVHDIPGIVEAFAQSSGTPIVAHSVARPNYALIDHWYDGDALRELKDRRYQFVVLQQGYTPAGVCRDTLRLVAVEFAHQATPLGTQVAMFEAWAPLSRYNQFPGTIGSYRLAAKDAGGVLLPVGEAWQRAIDAGVATELYDDDLHPSQLGSYYSALVIYARLTQRSPVGLPASVTTASGERIGVPAALALQLQEHAAAIALTPTPDEIPPAQVVVTSRC